MADVMHGIEDDVPFDFGVAAAFATACDDAGTAVGGQAGSRSTWVATGMVDFKGHFSRLFASNARVASADALELSNRLHEVAQQARRLAEEARKEQQRRETARAWKKEHDDRNVFEKGWDWAFGGGDDPPVGPPAEPPNIPISAPVNGTRETPSPGGGGGGGGSTSSARPSNLRSFATSSKGANDELRPRPPALRGKYSEFQSGCHWGSLDASGVFAGFDKWLAANDEDVRWATVVANAFKAAGGEGRVSTLANSAIAAALKAAHVHAARQDITINLDQAIGNPPTTGYSDDPVNTATGNFVENEVDLGFPGASSWLSLARCYNSFGEVLSERTGAFGPGWASLAEAGLAFSAEEGLALLTLPDGRVVHFPRLGDGWDRAVGENLWLEAADEEGAGGSRDLLVTGNDGTWWRCAADGTLLAYGSGPQDGGNVVSLVRDEGGRLVRLQHARGRSITLIWGEAGAAPRVLAATSSDGRRVDYRYDDQGRLVAAAGPLGTRTYRLDEHSLIAAVVDADGVVEVENTYDEQRRVLTQRSAFGRVSRYTYLAGRVTVVADEDGTRSNTWIADERGRLVGVVDADEQRQSTSYDRYGNAVLVTARDGAATIHEYDDRGRRVRTVTPSGADITSGYDDLDRVTTVVAESGGVTELAYEGEDRNPSRLTDPEGGVTELLWREGLLQQVTDPTGVVVRLGYDAAGDLVATTNADGQTARVERDDLGRVIAAITPSGRRTEFDFDPVTGLLAARRNPDGATWRYEYTAGGRQTAVVDPLGARSTIERGASGEEARHVDPLGRALVRQLDDLGLLARVELPDGSTWQFAHDALSRLTGSTDPTGATWLREYDATGALQATVDPTGVRRGVRADQGRGQISFEDGFASTTAGLDPLGRVTSLEQPDGSAALYVYDRCGRVLESLDAEGGLTRIERDAAGRPVRVTSPTGAVTAYAYDRCGRLVSVVDPLGAETTIAYDVDGQPVRQTLPTGEVATSDYDVCGRVLVHHRPGVGTLRYRYDPTGRVVETRDPSHGRRQFRYDAAGQLVAAVDGNGGVTSYAYDALGRATEITNPLGGVTRREFDGMNRCVAETDPLGRTTRAAYDAAGRQVSQTDPDGHVTTWTYDAAGRLAATAVDGRTLSTLSRDVRRRQLTVADTTGPSASEHVLEWDRRGQLVRRSRDGREVSWTYDADGRRTSMTTPDGSTTRYGWDAAGRVTSIEHSLLGRAAFDRDAAGRITSAVAGGLIQSWERRDGFVVGHSLTDDTGVSRTSVERDGDGRVQRLTRDRGAGPEVTDYAYDGAGQLLEARCRRTEGSTLFRWRYDAAGRLVEESEDGATRQHTYDLAGQLLATVRDGNRVDYAYDSAGRRTRAADSHGEVTEYVWSPLGHLASISERRDDRVRRTTLHADALGELATVDGTELFWDTAAYAGAPVLVGDTAVVAAGTTTGIGGPEGGWTAPGWRTGRSAGEDPWGMAPGSTIGGGTGGITLGAAGEVSVAGLEWLGARVYDPAGRGFLSVDPLDPTTGAGWAGNPYSYAGNDPLHALDPTGLHPVTDAELQAYRDSNGIGGAVRAVGGALSTAWHATTTWVSHNWEYLAGGAMVIAGAALMFTGVGGPAGMMLMSAGADTIIQKATKGSVNWWEVGVSGALGAWGGVGAAARLGVESVAGRVIVGGMISGAGSGAAGSGVTYLTEPGPKSVGGFFSTTAQGAAVGTLSGGVLSAGGHGLDVAGTRLLRHVVPTPPTPLAVDARALLGNPGDTVVLGRQVDTAVAQDWPEHVVLNTNDWSLDLNDEFIRGAIDYQRPVYLASPTEGNLIQTSGDYAGQPTIYARELDMLREAGYTPQGDYLVPPH